MRIRFPSSEIATLAALYVAAAQWSHGTGIRPGAVLGMVILLVVAWSARRAVRHDGPTLVGELLLLGASASAVAFGTMVSEAPPSSAVAWTRGITFGLLASSAIFAALRLGRDDRASPFSWFAAVVALAFGVLAFGPRGVHVPWGIFALGALLPIVAFAFAVRYELTPAPRTRASFVIPGALAGVASGVLFVASLARGARPDASLVLAAVACALVFVGLAFGVRGGGHKWRRPIVQGAGALVAGGVAATVAAGLADDVALAAASGVIAGAAIAIAAGAGKLRVDRGRLLDACRVASDKVTGAERLEDLAAAVLEPLRLATRDLQAPAEMWVLPFEARFVLDVSGAALRSKLSHAAERAVLSWLRARPGDVVFSDALRPLEVRRAEVRPVLASLAERDAFAAIPLVEGDELLGVIVLPRGRRDAFPTLDEDEALSHLGRRVAASLSMVMALERARDRANEAVARAQTAESRAETAEQERERALARLRGVRAVRAVGTLEDTWVGYSDAMRRFESQLRAVAQREDPVAFVTEPGMAVAAVARVLHANSTRAGEACVIVDAGEVHPRDALATLVGTAAGTDDDGAPTPAMPGWFELVQGGTLVVIDAAALGSDAHLALIDAMGTATARRLGGGAPYEVSARIVITARDSLANTGLPAELCDRFAASTLRVPALRDRPEDLETLVLFAIDRACRLHGRSAVGIRRDALESLRRYLWPENDRELYEALEHAVRVVRGAQITIDDLPEAVRGVRVPPGENREGETESYDALERRILQAALDRASGNKSEAARALGLKRTTFLDKLRKYGLRV